LKTLKKLIEKSDRRHNDLRAAESRRLDDLRLLSASYEKEMREAEAKRLDNIRVVDATAVSIANERAVQQANVLAAQVATSAETQRTLVASTASTIATQLQQIVTPLTERLASVEKSIFEGQGKSTVVDPLMASMVNELKALGTVTAALAARFSDMDPILAAIVTELKSVSSAVSTSKGAEGVSIPVMISIAGAVGAALVYVLTHLHF
jgi:hypothetical protein